MSEPLESKIMRLLQAATMRPVDLDEPLLDSGLIDSIAAVDLALELEREFHIEIPAAQIHQHMRTARALISYVRLSTP